MNRQTTSVYNEINKTIEAYDVFAQYLVSIIEDGTASETIMAPVLETVLNRWRIASDQLGIFVKIFKAHKEGKVNKKKFKEFLCDLNESNKVLLV